MTTVAIVGSKGIPACYGGFETLAENLVQQLRSEYSFIVYCSGPAYEEQPVEHLGARLRYLPLEANGMQSIPYDVISMLDARRRADIVLILGVSGCLFLPLIKMFSRKKFIAHLDGIDWRRSKWGVLARNFLKLSEWVAAHTADQLIADNKVIQQYIKERYGKDSFLVAYGGDHALVDLPQTNADSLSVLAMKKTQDWARPVEDVVPFERYAVLVCRIEPENNIHVILEAFSRAGSTPLVAIGNWDHSAYGQTLKEQYRDAESLCLLDPIYDQDRLFNLRSKADFYVHGHSAGGTNPALVEAMCLGLPVFAYDVPFNRATTHEAAKYFADAESLAAHINEISTESLDANGQAMRELAEQEYTWTAIAGRYASLFGGAAVEAISRELSSVAPREVPGSFVSQPGNNVLRQPEQID